MRSGRLRSLLLASLIASCGTPPAPPPLDAGGDAADASVGEDAGLDAGPADAGEVPDAGDPADAGEEPDAGDAPFDAGVRDAGQIPPTPPDAGAGKCFQASGSGTPFTLRAVAANLTSGNCQSYDPGEGLRILQGLQADVVMIQEFNYYSTHPALGCPATRLDEVGEFIEKLAPDAGFSWSRGLTGKIPNGIISRWPIIAWGDWDDYLTTDRELTWALIDLPGPRDLWVVSVHLLTTGSGDRASEGAQLVYALDHHVPAGDFVLVGGDFNISRTSEAVLTTLGARWLVVRPPVPTDQHNNDGTNTNRDKPYDQVLASRCLAPLQVPVVIGSRSYDAGLVFDSRDYTPLSDVPPVLAGDSAGFQMQHMAVVKDFLIQP